MAGWGIGLDSVQTHSRELLSTVSASTTSLTTQCFVGARLIGSERAAALQLENLSLCLEECSGASQ